MSNKVKFVCKCGNVFYRSTVREGQVYACSMECRRKILEEVGYECALCKKRLSGDCFNWFDDERYACGKRRVPYCITCKNVKLEEYRDTNKAKTSARIAHEMERSQSFCRWR